MALDILFIFLGKCWQWILNWFICAENLRAHLCIHQTLNLAADTTFSIWKFAENRFGMASFQYNVAVFNDAQEGLTYCKKSSFFWIIILFLIITSALRYPFFLDFGVCCTVHIDIVGIHQVQGWFEIYLENTLTVCSSTVNLEAYASDVFNTSLAFFRSWEKRT